MDWFGALYRQGDMRIMDHWTDREMKALMAGVVLLLLLPLLISELGAGWFLVLCLVGGSVYNNREKKRKDTRGKHCNTNKEN